MDFAREFSDLARELGEDQFAWLLAAIKRPKTIFVLDYDGTVVEPGEQLSAADISVFRKLKSYGVKVCIVTAQSRDYMSHLDPTIFTGMVFECNIEGTNSEGRSQLYVPLDDMLDVQVEMEQYIEDLQWTLQFPVNRKTAGFAVDIAGATKAQADVIISKVRTMGTRDNMRCAVTSGYVDYMLFSFFQSKARGLQRIMEEYQGYEIIAAGDSPTTDGPMLGLADKAYIVGGKTYRDAVHVSSPAIIMRMMELNLAYHIALGEEKIAGYTRRRRPASFDGSNSSGRSG